MNVPELDLPRVVIIGGGFAGLNLARRLNTRRVQIVLFDQNNYHTFQPLMYQVATAGLEPDSIAYPIRKTLKRRKHTHFRMGKVHQVDAVQQKVYTSIGSLHYDYLVIATGADTNFFGMEDLQTNAMPMKSLVESLNLRSLVLQNFENALNEHDIREQKAHMNFVIVGAGPTGVELAGALAELKEHILPRDYPDLDIRKMQIHVIEAAPQVLAAMSDEASRKSEKFLKDMGVNVWLNQQVKSYDGSMVQTNEKTFNSKTVIWAAGVAGSPVPGLDKAEIVRGNRIKVDGFCQVDGYENIFAAGDVAQMITEEEPNGYPMLGSVAMQQGRFLAKHLSGLVKGEKGSPFRYNDKGTMATIGRNKAVVDLPRWKFSGFFAWLTWMFVHLMLLVDFRSRLIVFVNWTWSYINFDRGTRLIVRKFKRKE